VYHVHVEYATCIRYSRMHCVSAQRDACNVRNQLPGVSRLLDEIETKFQRLPPIFMTAIPMELLVKLSAVTESGKSKMAASKLRLRLSQLVHKIATKFQRLCQFFGVQLSNMDSDNVVRPNGKKPDAENQNGGH